MTSLESESTLAIFNVLLLNDLLLIRRKGKWLDVTGTRKWHKAPKSLTTTEHTHCKETHPGDTSHLHQLLRRVE